MRRSLSQRRATYRARRGARGGSPVAALFARLTRPAGAWPHGRGRAWWTAPVLALLLALAGFGMAGAQPPLARALAGAHGAGAIPGARTTPAATNRTHARWHDETNGTTLVMQLIETGNGLPGQFTFTIPTGDQIVVSGSVLSKQPPSSNAPALIQLAQTLRTLPPDASFDSQVTACAPATIVSHGTQQSTPQLLKQGITQSGIATLTLHVGQGGLVAYAALTVAALGSGTSCVQSDPPQFQMEDGCTPTGCSAPPPPAGRASNYGSAVSAAARSRNWSTVYQQNSQAVREQYSASEFTAQMQAAADRYGQITAVSAPLGPAVIQVNDAGQAYFVVDQTVTYQLNGSTKQARVTSYYLLEDGDWHFWFSEAPH